MKRAITTFLFFITASASFSQGFQNPPINWSLPQGGLKYGGTHYSFMELYCQISSGIDDSSQQWSTIDMNGDGKPDLVVYQEKQSGVNNVYGLPSSPYWKVYLNTGTEFSTVPINWILPPGGLAYGGTNYSFMELYCAIESGVDEGSQEWSTTDMNGDGKPDLVVYREKQSGINNVYGLPSSPYWKVYLNTGTGFSTTAINWILPPGGLAYGGINYSFMELYCQVSSGIDDGSQQWSTTDMNGDAKPDLVVYQEKQSGINNVFGLPSSPYWKVYLNTGTGFSTTAINWILPPGGLANSGINYSFMELDCQISSGIDDGSQQWSTTDMNGDGKRDIVVYQEKQSGINNVYGLPSSPYWKVYLNTGTGFSTVPINWILPPGGLAYGGTNYSFMELYCAIESGVDEGSQEWSTTDMNGDGKPDMVVYREKQSGVNNVYGLPASPYWKVYLNTGTGFSTVAINWTLPPGGLAYGGTNYSFMELYCQISSGIDDGSQQWSVIDMNGDGKLDLVVYQERQSGIDNVYGLPSSPYWKVYLNNSATTGINVPKNNDGDTFVYPNPFAGNTTIKAGNNLIGEHYKIYDNAGKIICEGKLQEEFVNINLIDFADGNYFLEVGGQKKQVIKLLKQ